MSEAESVLERKARAQRKAHDIGAMAVPRALGRSLSIAADALWGLGCTATVQSDVPASPERAVEALSSDNLLIVIAAEDRPCGLVALSREIVTGLIEVQTLGKVTRMPLDDRRFTPTDGAMMAPLIEAALPRFASMLAGQPDLAHLQSFAFAAFAEDRQTAGLALDAATYRVLGYDVSLAQDTRRGHATFLFPEPDKPSSAKSGQPREGKHAAELRLVPARMQAVLTRIHIPLEKAQALKPGDLLPISGAALASTMLVVDGGHVAARGKMGQMNGFRAVRIGGQESPLHPPVAAQPPESPALPQTSGTDAAPLKTADLTIDTSFETSPGELARTQPDGS
ncbi:FliM/FliN family flagellar motor C-terminal domain-containing protein [Marivita sp. GX14005]|uniref:FliM/FliN family flagellar motor switch protein n=1 Tax=Marivita sp. GX14005 TaxID=2942276 RepID=UPI0020199A64|nr:FliM/FliN family flagellar motor C-terminal domain-containing protein [Marivita sp. GX14005]MCL3880798.1 FliM/FliN family flagellar motor C-terminal domain-containing protein [Marivita sp. GX14005]